MAINFPDSPTNGQVALVGGKNYTYNSTKNTWTPTQVTEADLSTVGSTTVVATHDLLPASPSAGDMALVSSVNKMYVYFLSGWWLMSSLQNASPSGITGNAAIYDLAADGTPTTVTLSSSDPEGFPISWSHSIISGSLGGTTVTNVNNVFTITPSTDAADAGTFTLRFAASDGQGGESGSQSQFTLDFVFTITNSRYTTLLATATGTSDNNNITDSSTNNHTPTLINPTNALTQGSFSPYRSGGYSIFFDNTTPTGGSGTYSIRYASATTSDFVMGTNAFTIEGWIKPYDTGSGSRRFYQNRYSSTGNGKGSIFQNGSNLYMSYRGDDGIDYELGPYSVLTVNTWTHFCLLRNTSDNTLKLYADGTLLGSIAVPSNVGIYNSSSNTYIGDAFGGEMADIRVINGTALAPPTGGPTAKLENVTNTVLLLNGPNLVDYSGIAPIHSDPYIYDTPIIKTSSPYDYLEYSVADYGGSIQSTNFDDTSAGRTGLSFADHADFDLAGSDWTFEWWAYVPKSEGVNNHNFINKGPQGAIRPYSFNYRLESGQPGWEPRMFGSSDGSSQWSGYSGSAWQPWSTWTHVAFVRNGSTITRYINGKAYGTGSGDVFDNNELLYVGGGYGDEQPHTYSDLRISKSAVYTAEFTPPTAPLPSSGSVLHLKGANASIIDKSQRYNIDLGSTSIVGHLTTKWSGAKSIYINSNSNNSDLITLPAGVLDASKPFTIEMWLRTNSGAVSGFWSIYTDATNLMRLKMRGDDRLEFYHRSGSYEQEIKDETNTYLLNNTDFYHVAVTRDSNNVFYMHQNGIKLGNFTASADYNSSAASFIIGKSQPATERYMDGYIQDFRITQGLARYTAADETSNIPTAPLEG